MNQTAFTDPSPDGVRNLLGTALDDVEFEGDVVPGVVAGYERSIRARRFQILGSGLAVVAIATAAVSVLPHSGGGKSATVNGPAKAPTSNATVPSNTAFPNDGCTQHWDDSQNYMDQSKVATSRITHSVEQNSALCKAFVVAFQGAVPGVQVRPVVDPDLTRDPEVDQKLLRQWNDELRKLPTGVPQDMPEFKKVVDSEYARLLTHPADPSNSARPGFFTVVTAAGSAEYQLSYMDQASYDMTPGGVAKEHPADCASSSAAKVPGLCTDITAGSWHGAAYVDPVLTMQAVTMTDGSGHYFTLQTNGIDQSTWVAATMDSGKNDSQGHAIYVDSTTGKTYDTPMYKNVYTGVLRADEPPRRVPLTDDQFHHLVAGDVFGNFLAGGLTKYIGGK